METGGGPGSLQAITASLVIWSSLPRHGYAPFLGVRGTLNRSVAGDWLEPSVVLYTHHKWEFVPISRAKGKYREYKIDCRNLNVILGSVCM